MSAFPCSVDGAGKLTLDYPAQFFAFAKRFAGIDAEIELRKRRTKRSKKQNDYYWSVVVPLIAEECGYSSDQMHQALKVKFLSQEDLSRGLMRVGSTTKLSTAEFVEFTDRVVLWAAEYLGVIIPQPEREPAKRKKAA